MKYGTEAEMLVCMNLGGPAPIARGAGSADRMLAVAPAYDLSFALLRRAARISGDFLETGMRMTMTDRTGGCACGAIRFKITAPLMGVGVCHCTDCQKASGGGPNYVALAPKTLSKSRRARPGSTSVRATAARTPGAPSVRIAGLRCGACPPMRRSRPLSLVRSTTIRT